MDKDILCNLVDANYHETLDRYKPRTADFLDEVIGGLPDGWHISRQHIWYFCSPSELELPQQGWKIHISATVTDARKILDRACGVLFGQGDVAFKFAVDFPILQLLTGKNFSRSGASKFITVYPKDDEQFVRLMETLHGELEEFHAPYILSDYRYKDSSIVFYRYGGMNLQCRLNIRGEKVPVLNTPKGDQVPDLRLPFPYTPEWAVLPVTIPERQVPTKLKPSLQNGRFAVEEVICFSNSGGVYKAIDCRNGMQVVIKEARPLIQSMASGEDTIGRLKKEFDLLTDLADSGVAPKPIALFQEWEHWFLVEEFIDGMVLSTHSAANNILLRTRPSPDDYSKWSQTLREIVLGVVAIIETLHARGIVFSDLSPKNLMVVRGTTKVRIIDFEGARKMGSDTETFYTPGFISPRRLGGASASFEDDYYSIGAVLFSYLFPWHAFLHLKRQALPELLQMICNDAQLKIPAEKIILGLTNENCSERPGPVQVRELLSERTSANSEKYMAANSKFDPSLSVTVVHDVVKHWKSVADYSRIDRIFPADSSIFATNPLSLGFGAGGVAYAWHRITGSVSSELINAVANQRLSQDQYPPGLFVGMAGIAWALLELGEQSRAEEILKHACTHSLAYEANDLFYGIAGWGLSCLRMFAATGNEYYLSLAIRGGEGLLQRSKIDERGRSWPNEAETPLGLAFGSAGISLFLLYLYLCTNNELFLQAGREALDFDLSFGVETKDAGLSWPRTAGSLSPIYPYWQYGSAGIGQVALRYLKLTNDPAYQNVVDKIFIDADRKYSVFLGRFRGLAGIGEFLLDLHWFTGKEVYRDSAKKLASTIMAFGVEKDGGIAFPGESGSRLCCDFGTGSSGIALFLNRLMGRQGDDLMLDSLFKITAPETTRHEGMPVSSLGN